MHAEQMLNAELETITTQSAHAQLDTMEIHLNIAHSNVSVTWIRESNAVIGYSYYIIFEDSNNNQFVFNQQQPHDQKPHHDQEA